MEIGKDLVKQAGSKSFHGYIMIKGMENCLNLIQDLDAFTVAYKIIFPSFVFLKQLKRKFEFSTLLLCMNGLIMIVITKICFTFSRDFLLCFYCATQSKKGTLLAERNKEETYISKGFRSWKKAPRCFEDHQRSKCHQAAASYHLVPSADIQELTNKTLVNSRQVHRGYLIDVMRCLHYLARQGLALQGTHHEDNFTQLLLFLGTKDPNILKALDQSGRKYTHHDVQNELLDYMARQVLAAKIDQIRQNGIYAIMCDEYTDCSNKEQMTFCARTVDDQLQVEEDFLGFYEVDNIKSDTLVAAIKDILLRFNLPIESCRGQTYDGASNMFGKKSGVSTQILTLQPKALATHCYGHSLSLAVKDLTSCCKILRDTMSTVGEICVLIKYSPKREKMLGMMSSNIEGIEDVDIDNGTSLDKLSETRWTVRASCFQKIIDSYSNLQSLWDICQAENLTREVRSRIVGCQGQMKSFSFFFGLCLAQRLFSLTDNLSKTLQKENMSAVSGQRLAMLVKETVDGMRSEENFKLFYASVIKKALLKSNIALPTLPRKRKRLDYSILLYIDGYQQAAPAYHPTTPEDHYREIYNEAIDSVSQALMTRFNQESYKVFSGLEQLLLKGIENQSYNEELATLRKVYCDDVDTTSLEMELQMLKTVSKGENPQHAADIFKIMRNHKDEMKLMPNVVKIANLLLVNGATTATPERSFSTARRLKTWLRSTMSQRRFNSLAILNTYKDLSDKINFLKVGNMFVDSQEKRYNYFGKFIPEDLA